jgi:hypothetical protein
MNRTILASILGFAGTVCMMAMAFNILPNNIGIFLGLVCYMAAGLVWSLPVFRGDRD